MSPLWRDRLSVYVAPDRLSAVRWRRGLHPEISDKTSRPCEPLSGSESDLGSITQTLAALLLDQPGSADVVLVLSSHFSRYALIPWSEELTGAEDIDALVRHHFTRIYGDAARLWSLRLSAETKGAARVACALDTTLLDALRAVCAGTPHRLRSIQPALMAVFNGWRRELGEEDGWLVVVEPQRVCSARIASGGWRQIRTSRVHPGQTIDLTELLEREMTLSGEIGVPRNAMVFAPFATDLPELPGWSMRRLKSAEQSGYNPDLDSAYSLALLGRHGCAR